MQKLIFQISFVIPQEVVPGRMGLLITLLLVLVNLFISITANSPNTDSLTWISVWVMACIIFVQVAVMEYGCILLFKYVMYHPTSEVGRKIFYRVDLLSLFISIGSFITFIVIYCYLIP